MSNSSYKIAVIPDVRRAKQNGEFPLRIRISKKKDRWYFPTNESCTLDLFEKAFTRKPRADAKALNKIITDLVKQAEDILDTLPTFTAELFRSKFSNSDVKTTDDVFTLFEQIISNRKGLGRIGTAKAYTTAFRSFRAFHAGKLKEHMESLSLGKAKSELQVKPLPFADVTAQWLRNYHNEMILIGNSKTTISMNMRALKVVLNEAINSEHQLMKLELYPFTRTDAEANRKDKYKIPKSDNSKRPLTPEQIKRLVNIEEMKLTPLEVQSRDLFLFSTFCNGMNFCDIAYIKKSDINEDENGGATFKFYRQKNINKDNQKLIIVSLPKEIWQRVKPIIKKYGSKKGKFLFPFIEDAYTPEYKKDAIQKLIKVTNLRLKKIAQKCNIEVELSTYYARHSYATLMKEAGASVSMISDGLGHMNTITTDNYLSSIETPKTAKLLGEAFNFL